MPSCENNSLNYKEPQLLQLNKTPKLREDEQLNKPKLIENEQLNKPKLIENELKKRKQNLKPPN